ncbi:hypothetical protein BJ741DRAFT_157364 [Chytriomyces cf. hyalinus JEL632]|nr:hypothetical protein BJ741DRAFT_157364 [Chytriomyces cf. hyalinus JEL632]
MAVPSLDGGLQLLHEALIVAVCQKWLECVDAILNDPLGRVTQQDRDAALVQCAHRTILPIPALLIQNGVSTQGLNEAFLAAIRYDSPEFASLLLMQPEIEPDYQRGLEEAVNHDNTSIAKLLLDIGEVSIPANDYRALRRALYVGKTNQVILLLEAAQRLKDVEAVRIANEWMDQERGAHFTQTVRAQIQTWADEIKPSGSDSVSFSGRSSS